MNNEFFTSVPSLDLKDIPAVIPIPGNEDECAERYGCTMEYVWLTFTKSEAIKIQNKIRAEWKENPPKSDADARKVAQKMADEYVVTFTKTKVEKAREAGMSEDMIDTLKDLGIL